MAKKKCEQYRKGHLIAFRVTEAEYARIVTQAKRLEIKNVSQYCRECVLDQDKFAVLASRRREREMLISLRRITSSLNAMAKLMEAGRGEKEELSALFSEAGELLRMAEITSAKFGGSAGIGRTEGNPETAPRQNPPPK